MEKRLFKKLLSKQFHAEIQHLLNKDFFGSTFKELLEVVTYAHEKYEGDIDTEVLFSLYVDMYSPTTAKQKLILGLVRDVEEEETIADDVAIDLITRLHKKGLAHQLAERALDLSEGADISISDIEGLVEALRSNNVEQSHLEEVTKDVLTLLELESQSGKWQLKLPSLADRVPGLSPKNNVIIFGRPEVGKSSFVAYLNVGFLEQGAKVVYFGNEEPGAKIMLNHIRSAEDLSDAGLLANKGKGYEKWDRIKDNFTLHDTTDASLSEIDSYLSRNDFDIVVLDQTDKLSLDRKYSNTTERLKDLYCEIRGVARRREVCIINVSQAGADAEGCREVNYDTLDMSKTGKPGEADIILGIGKGPGVNEEIPLNRYITVSKNKISGGGWRGVIPTYFIPQTCMFNVAPEN